MYKSKNRDFQILHNQAKEYILLESVHNILEWDQETYMPSAGINIRSDQLEITAKHLHKLKTAPKFKKALSKLMDLDSKMIVSQELTEKEISCLQRWHRDYHLSAALPKAHVAMSARTCSKALHVWAEAKQAQSFAKFAPHLKKIVELARKKASYLTYKDHPYDALLDLYEPGMTTKTLDPLFTRLQIALTDLLRKIAIRPKISQSFLRCHYPQNEQLTISAKILKLFPFSEGTTRLDLSTHPFCNALNPNDVRMTTRIIPDRPLSNIFSVLHEAGHGLYEAQLDLHWYGTPLCQSLSLGVHESQSRLWETFIGRSYSFCKFLFPILQHQFPSQLSGVDLEGFYQAMNLVEPSLIRTEADEVTYCLHVIIRYEIEKELLAGTLQVEDIPEVWNEKMRSYLGVVPDSDDVGCLQDIHWAMGGFGYFPTYALGNLYAAQIHQAFIRDYPEWQQQLEHGDFSKLGIWLSEHLHSKGRLYSPQETIKKLSRKDLSEKDFITYLQEKYGNIYHLSH